MSCDFTFMSSVQEKVDGIITPSDTKLKEFKVRDEIVSKDIRGIKRAVPTADERDAMQRQLDKLNTKLDNIPIEINPDNGMAVTSSSEALLMRRIEVLEAKLQKALSYNEDLVSSYKAEQVFTPTNYNEKITTQYTDTKVDYGKWMGEIEDYTSNGYLDTRNTDTTGIHKFLNDAPTNFKGLTYRGSRLTSDQLNALDAYVKEGSILSNINPMSTSTDFDVAKGFTKGDIQNGRKDAIFTFNTTGHDVRNYSTYSNEDEVLIGHGKHFQVLSKFETDMQVHILLEEIDPEIVKLMGTSKSKIGSDIFGLLGIGLGLSQIKGETNG